MSEGGAEISVAEKRLEGKFEPFLVSVLKRIIRTKNLKKKSMKELLLCECYVIHRWGRRRTCSYSVYTHTERDCVFVCTPPPLG